MVKLCLIGAGSTEFTKRIVTDLLLMPEFRSMELALMDIDAERLRVSDLIVRAVAREIGATPKITMHTDRRQALEGSHFVQTSIQVGGYDPATKIDFDIPRNYGLRQTIADTLGMGGIMRGLRTIPVLVDIGRDIMDICPEAIWLQYVNPMCMNMMAIERMVPGVQAVGLCHSVQGTAEMLADDLGEKMEDIVFQCAGINHMAFYLNFGKRLEDGTTEDLYPRLRDLARKISSGEDQYSSRARKKRPEGHRMQHLTERVRYEMLNRLGYFVTESSEHFAEYVPWFIKRDRPDLLEQYQVPLDEYVDRCEYSLKRWGDYAQTLKEESKLETYRSNEYAGEIIRAVVTGNPVVINGNVPNRGLIDNLPEDACVEVPCLIDRSGISPTRIGKIPPHLAALIQTNVNVQQLTVEAAATGKRESVYHAAMMDPHTAAELSLDQIWKLTDELIEAHGDMIPTLS
jgi:alpha-galactosidase